MFSFVAFVLRRGLFPLIFIGFGWYGGAKFGAPDLVIRAIDGVAARATIALEPVLNRSVEEGTEIVADVVDEGSDYVVGTLEDFLVDLATVPDKDKAEVAGDETAENSNAANANDSNPTTAAPSLTNIVLCKMHITNAPRANSAGVVKPGNATVRKNGISLLLMPATKSCVSSGFGPRSGKLHKGIDYFTREDGDVLAAADGVIRERVTRRDYGNMLVIDHGDGVFTRYAHLARFGRKYKRRFKGINWDKCWARLAIPALQLLFICTTRSSLANGSTGPVRSV